MPTWKVNTRTPIPAVKNVTTPGIKPTNKLVQPLDSKLVAIVATSEEGENEETQEEGTNPSIHYDPGKKNYKPYESDSSFTPTTTSSSSSSKTVKSRKSSSAKTSTRKESRSSRSSSEIPKTRTVKRGDNVHKPKIQVHKIPFGWPAQYPLPMLPRFDMRICSTQRHSYCNVDLRAFPTADWDSKKSALRTVHTNPPGIDGSFLYIGPANSRSRSDNYAI